MLSNNSSHEASFMTCQITQTPITDNFFIHSLVNMQLASRSPLLRTGFCSLGNVCDFLQGLLGLPLQSAIWLRPLSLSKLSQTFRANIYPYPQTPAISRGRIRGQANTRPGALVFGSCKAHFWKLGCCIWSLLLETSERNFTQYQRQVQGYVSRPGMCLACCYVYKDTDSTYPTSAKLSRIQNFFRQGF